jgi:hypothetical protein
MMKSNILQAALLALLFLMGCDKEEKFSCNLDGQFTLNGNPDCADAWVKSHAIQETGTLSEDLLLLLGPFQLSVGTSKEIFQVGKAYTNLMMARPQTPAAWVNSTSIDLQSIDLISITFTKLDRSNKIMSGTFTLDTKHIVAGKVEPLVGSGSFTNVPY